MTVRQEKESANVSNELLFQTHSCNCPNIPNAGQIEARSEWFHASVAGVQAATDKQHRLENKSHRTGQ